MRLPEWLRLTRGAPKITSLGEPGVIEFTLRVDLRPLHRALRHAAEGIRRLVRQVNASPVMRQLVANLAEAARRRRDLDEIREIAFRERAFALVYLDVCVDDVYRDLGLERSHR